MTPENAQNVVQLNSTATDTTATSADSATSGLNSDVLIQAVSIAPQGQTNHLNPNPECDKDCRFHYGVSVTTAMYYSPVFDKYGNNLNPDGNTTSGEITCSVCERKWSYSTRYNQTDFKETK